MWLLLSWRNSDHPAQTALVSAAGNEANNNIAICNCKVIAWFGIWWGHKSWYAAACKNMLQSILWSFHHLWVMTALPQALDSLWPCSAQCFQLSSGTRLWLGRFISSSAWVHLRCFLSSPVTCEAQLPLAQDLRTHSFTHCSPNMWCVGSWMTGSLQPGMCRCFADVWLVMQIIPLYLTDSKAFLSAVGGYVAFYWTMRDEASLVCSHGLL